MTIGAYFTLFRPNDYEVPFEQSITSVASQVDSVLVLVDPRFKDGAWEALASLSKTFTNVRPLLSECPLDEKYPLAAWKNEARISLDTDWLLECDPMWVFPQHLSALCEGLLPSLSVNNICVGFGSLNFFNGDNIKHVHPKVLPILSRNVEGVQHGSPERRGCGLRTSGGRPIQHSIATARTEFSRGLPADVDSLESLWVYNYEWYEVPGQYEQKGLNHYLEGRAAGTYKSVGDYDIDLDGNEVDLFDVTFRLPLSNYRIPLIDEMLDRSVKRVGISHPAHMEGWISKARTLDTRRFVVTNMRRRVAKALERRRSRRLEQKQQPPPV